MPEINIKASVGIEYSAAVVLFKCLHSGGFFTMDLGSPLNGQFFICHIGKFSLSVFNEFFFLCHENWHNKCSKGLERLFRRQDTYCQA